MRKRGFICLLVIAMVTTSACGKKAGTSNDSSIEIVESKTVESSTESAAASSATTEENNKNTESVEQTTLKSGPEYCVGEYRATLTYWNEAAWEDIIAEELSGTQLFIVSDGYEALKEQINYYNISNYNAFAEDRSLTSDNINAEDFELEYAYFPWEYSTSTYVTRNDEQVFSFLRSEYSYMGGAHGYHYNIGYSLVPETGRKISLADVVLNISAFTEALKEKIAYTYEDELFDDWVDTLETMVSNDEVSFILSEDSLNVWFDTYALAPYATGEIDADFLYTEYPEFINPEYFHEKGIVVEKTDTDPYEHATPFYKTVVEPLSSKVGIWSYNELKEFIESTGYEYTYGEPDIEEDGFFRLVDPDNDVVFYAFCWTTDIETEEDYMDPDKHYFYCLNYRYEGSNLFVQNAIDNRNIVYYSTVTSDYENIYFNNMEDVTRYLFATK